MVMLFNKIKELGIKSCISILVYKMNMLINDSFILIFRLFPLKSNYIILESEPDMSDNSYAFYEYVQSKKDSKYKYIWILDDVKNLIVSNPNTVAIKKWPNSINVKRDYYLAVSKWYIYDHTNVIKDLKKRKKQQLVYLSHGVGYKMKKGEQGKQYKCSPDYIVSTGELSAKKLSFYWNEPIEKIIITGYPRYDYLFEKKEIITKKIYQKWQFDKFEKIVFWMPTFRQSINKDLSENYIDNQTGLPFFSSHRELSDFNEYLNEHNILLVLKLHHLQADLPVYRNSFSNMVVIKDEELSKLSIQLYQFVSYADFLISDYSSISIDYLILDRPIIYTLDDYEQYDKSRGLYPENAKDYMPGYHVYCVNELELAINEIISGIDRYKEDRRKIAPLYHSYSDNKSSMRLLEFLGL